MAAATSSSPPLSWASRIRSAASQGRFLRAVSLFLQMRAAAAPPSPLPAALPAAIKSCTALRLRALGASLHALAVCSGAIADRFTANALLNLYCKVQPFHPATTTNNSNLARVCNETTELDATLRVWGSKRQFLEDLGHNSVRHATVQSVRNVFDEMPERDIVSWNILILGCAEHGLYQEAVDTVRKMWADGFRPDSFTLSSLLPILAEFADVSKGMEIHGFAIRNGFDAEVFIGSSLIDMYANCTRTDYSLRVFDGIPQRDPVLWDSILAGCAQNGAVEEALGIFRRMLEARIEPVPVTLASLIPACGNLTSLRLGKQLHGYVIRGGFDGNAFVSSSLIDMHCKCGNVSIARRIFDGMQSLDIVSWTAIIMGYALHGPAEEALVLFDKMELEKVRPNHITFLAILTACSHAGLVEKGWDYFERMSKDHGIAPSIEHFAALADVLGRAGELEEAYDFISNMHIKPTASVWSTLLRACRMHKNAALAEKVAKKMFELEPTEVRSRVILSNVYSAAGRWNEAACLRKSMRKKGAKKEPACSWIEVKNKVHVFVADDKSHPWYDRIVGALNVFLEHMGREGYVPNTEDVFQDLEKEQQESIWVQLQEGQFV